MSLSNKGCFKIYLDNNGTKGAQVGGEYVAQSIKLNFESIASEESGRSDSGKMHIVWVKQKVRKLEITMPPYTDAKSNDIKTLLSSIQGKVYWVEYFDTIDNNTKTIRVYTSNTSAECYSGVLFSGVWQGLSFSAIDMDGENYA